MKEDKDTIGNRMKSYYESRAKTFLTRRTPVIIRVDGKRFSRFCKRFEKPYDKLLNDALTAVSLSICGKVQGLKMAQRHSDEMSFLLTDYDTLTTDAFFDYNVQKVCSIVASMATSEFCRQLVQKQDENITAKKILDRNEDWPCFDARCFNIPEKEVANYFWWRILDAKRGSINMFAQSLFSHKQLQGKTCEQMQEMMFQEKGINWDKIPQEQKSGIIILKEKEMKVAYSRGPMDANNGTLVERNSWKPQPGPKTKSELDAIISCIIV